MGEYDKVQLLWRTQRERLEKLDELTMANQRLRFRSVSVHDSGFAVPLRTVARRRLVRCTPRLIDSDRKVA